MVAVNLSLGHGRRGEKTAAVTSVERGELIRLRRENNQLRRERGIFSRAAAWFARVRGAKRIEEAVPSGCSHP
jgi:transposase